MEAGTPAYPPAQPVVTPDIDGSVSRGRIFIFDPIKRCEPNAYQFTRMVKFFLVNGYVMTGDIGESDIILVNSCCVTKDMLAASRADLDAALARGKGKRVVLFGCLAGLPLPGVDRKDLIVIGPEHPDTLLELERHFPHHVPLSRIEVHHLPPVFYEPSQGLGYGDYLVMIAHGCANGCSYCNIRRVKGGVRSRPPETILDEIRQGLSLGVKEFALVADDCASYGRDLGIDLTLLLERMFSLGDGFRVKLGYLFPGMVLSHFERLRDLFATGRISYVNIPVQSGSQRILDLMNRRYDIAGIRQAVRQLRAAAPRTPFCTHFMINFPTESEADFQDCLHLADEFDGVIFLNYSDNQGTIAAGIQPKVPEQEVRRRLDLASDYVNRRRPGSGVVIGHFDCNMPYNLDRKARGC
ncbi:MAG: radical SAM protein [Thermodesulfobacteriota bacterium]